MTEYNIIVIINSSRDKVLMCRRSHEPYKGKINFVGGHIEAGENHLSAAYRELYEETSLTGDDTELNHIIDFTYHLDGCSLEMYCGVLKRDVEVSGDENELLWVDIGEDFSDLTKFAGDGNILYMMTVIRSQYL